MNVTTAADIARAHGLDPKRYRQALRDAHFSWYVHGASWTVEYGSPEHDDMMRVLRDLTGKRASEPWNARARFTPNRRSDSDEAYVLALCDEILEQKSIRQHGFDFLRGDAGLNGQRRMLPVDAWYPDLSLVIEYRERQHTEAVDFFDRRQTVSGVGRGEQRKIYDQRRCDTLPAHGIELVELDCHQFRCTANRRLVRCDADRRVIFEVLRRFLR